MIHRTLASADSMFQQRRIIFLITVLLFVSTLSIYLKSLGYSFIGFDTEVYVIKNTRVHAGLSLDNISWAFTSSFFANWHPLTWLSYMLDMELWGLNPAGFHATNLLLHACNSVFVFFILYRVTSSTVRSFLVAGLFSIHPMHIESVVWIAERKDVLSTFFFLLTILLYIIYLQRRTLLFYGLVLLAYLLALMSKAMVVTLPAILLILDFWPFGRFNAFPAVNKKIIFQNQLRKTSCYWILLEKIPLILLAAMTSWFTIIAQRGGIAPLATASLTERIATVFIAYIAYIKKTILPFDLAPLYPYYGTPTIFNTLAAISIFFAITGIVFFFRKKLPWLFVGWLWFVISLLPVIGIIPIGHHFIADRYTYIPHIGLFILCSWGLHSIISRYSRIKSFFPIVCCALLAAYGVLTSSQLDYWENDKTLWSRTLQVTENNYVAENMMGNVMLAEGKIEEARQHYLNSISINDANPEGHYNLALLLTNTGKPNEAIPHYQKAIYLSPSSFMFQYSLGIAYKMENRLEEAINSFQNAINIKPKFVDAHIQLGEIFLMKKEYDNAKKIYHFLQTIIPNNPEFPKAEMAIQNIILNNSNKVSTSESQAE